MKELWLNAFLLMPALPDAGRMFAEEHTIARTRDWSQIQSPILLPVKVSRKWGFVNDSGQLVINPQFDATEEFNEVLERCGVRLDYLRSGRFRIWLHSWMSAVVYGTVKVKQKGVKY